MLDLIVGQLRDQDSRRAGLAIAAGISIVIASGGVSQLLTAVKVAYDEDEKRSFIARRGLALLVTLGAIGFMVVFGLVAVLPAVLGRLELGPLSWVLQVLRSILVATIVSVGLAVIYRVRLGRDAPKIRWVSVGAVVAPRCSGWSPRSAPRSTSPASAATPRPTALWRVSW